MEKVDECASDEIEKKRMKRDDQQRKVKAMCLRRPRWKQCYLAAERSQRDSEAEEKTGDGVDEGGLPASSRFEEPIRGDLPISQSCDWRRRLYDFKHDSNPAGPKKPVEMIVTGLLFFRKSRMGAKGKKNTGRIQQSLREFWELLSGGKCRLLILEQFFVSTS